MELGFLYLYVENCIIKQFSHALSTKICARIVAVVSGHGHMSNGTGRA